MDPQNSAQNPNNNTPASCAEGSDAARSAPKQGQSATPSSLPTAAVSANPHRPFQPEEYRRFKSKFLDYLQDRKLPIRITGLAGSLPLFKHICMINHWIEERHLHHPDEAIMPILIGWIGPTAITQSDLERQIQRHSTLTAKSSSAAATPHRPPFRPAHNIKIDHQEHRLFEQIKQLKVQHPNTFFLLTGEHNTNISGEYWTSPERSDANGCDASTTLAPPSSACSQGKTHLRGNEMYNRISDTLRQFGLDMDTVVEGTTLRAVGRQDQSSSHVYTSWMHDFKLHMILDFMAHNIISILHKQDRSALTDASIQTALTRALQGVSKHLCGLQNRQWFGISTDDGRIYYAKNCSDDRIDNGEITLKRIIHDMQAAGQNNLCEPQQTTTITAFDLQLFNMMQFKRVLLNYGQDPLYALKANKVEIFFFPQVIISDPFAGYPKKWNFIKSQDSDDTHVLYHNYAQFIASEKDRKKERQRPYEIPYEIDDNLFYLRLTSLLNFKMRHPDYPLHLQCQAHDSVIAKLNEIHTTNLSETDISSNALPYPRLAPKNFDTIDLTSSTKLLYSQACWSLFLIGHQVYRYFIEGYYEQEHPNFSKATQLLNNHLSFIHQFNTQPEPQATQVSDFIKLFHSETTKLYSECQHHFHQSRALSLPPATLFVKVKSQSPSSEVTMPTAPK